MYISSERSVNYATMIARVLLLSKCEEQRSVVRFLWAEVQNMSEIHRDMLACTGKTIWTVATSPGGVHSSRNYRLEESAPPGDVGKVYTVFPKHAIHVPVNFTRVVPFIPQKSY